MSATVSYKGNTLTTVNNQTRVLNTSGKWLEDDITIVDVTQSSGGTPAISVVDTLDAKGGTVRTITALDISDTTATASDVAIGKYFYTSNGTKTAGSNSGSGDSSGQSVTGTITGDGTTVLSIPCSFAPDLIYVHTDMSSDASNRGIVSITIVKDKIMHVVSDTSTSSDTLSSVYIAEDITGYNDSTNPHALYSNNILTLDMVTNTSSNRFLSGQTYTYELSTLGSGGGSTLVQKTITLNGTYDPDDDNADGYSEVTVNVQGGASISEVANTYGTELVITSAPGSTPSATRHTLYFEYEDESTETEYTYYDDSFISSAITATTPTTRNNKTVTSAQLDGTEWYSYTPPTPSDTWTTIYDGQITAYQGAATIPSLADVYFAENETYRVTIDGTEYVRDTVHFTANGHDMWVVGNPDIIITTVESGDQFVVFNAGWGALYIYFNNEDSRDYTFKLEKKG